MDENQETLSEVKNNDNLKKLITTDYTYPETKDDEFQSKIYRKREFYYHKIPDRGEIKNYNDVKEIRDKSCGKKFSLYEQQALIRNFINLDTPYKGLLIFHGTGTGKTCLALNTSNAFKNTAVKYGTKIYLLLSGPLIKSAWKESLTSICSNEYLKEQDASVLVSAAERAKAKKNAINIALQYYRFMSYRSFYKKVLGEKIKEKVKTTDNKVKVAYRKTKEGEFERDISIDRIYNLNNTLIIVDEAHNLTGNAYGEALMKIIRNSINLKILLLTATPMKNLADDIIELLNFIRPTNAPIERDKVFNSNKNHLMDFKPGGIEYLRKMARGYVSYLRGADPITFAKRVEMGKIPKGLLFTKIIGCKMMDFQKKIYDEAIIQFVDDTLDRRSQAVANFAFPGLSQDHKSIIGYHGNDGISILKNQIKTNYEQLNKKIATEILHLDNELSDNEDMLYLSENQKTITGAIMKMHNLKHFSIKFYKALKKINRLVWGKKGPRTAFIYSNLVKVGIELFQEILLANGYLEYDEHSQNYKIHNDTRCYFCGQTYQYHKQLKLKQSVLSREKQKAASIEDISDSSTEYVKETEEIPEHEYYPATFISITGKSSDDAIDIIPEDKIQLLDNVFSHVDNREGKFVKFVLGSRVMNEGISLKNVAEVHILDVYFNLGKVDQVIGRAIRNCSHYKIITDKNRFPEVKVYKYAVEVDKGLSSEEELYQKAELKYVLIKKVERILKEIAIDCPLNRHGNIFPEELKMYENCIEPGKPNPDNRIVCPGICDYTQCDFICDEPTLNELYFDPKTRNYRKLSKDELDYSTFSHTLARNEIETVKMKVKDMYKISYVFTLKEIVKYVKNSYEGEKKELFDDFFVFKALDEMIPVTENDFNNFKDVVFDKFNRAGYLIYINKYYIFQPLDENENVPMYYRSVFDKKMHYDLTLYNYIKNTPRFASIRVKKVSEINKITDANKTDKNKTFDDAIYNFEDVMDYYDGRDEFKYVGIIDKESTRRKNKRIDELIDVFKIREQRSKILEKKRGTGIPSIKGAVCATSKDRDYLEDIAKEINIPLKGNETRTEICEMIQKRLLFLEKYSTAKNKNKFTYIIIPKNHPLYSHPYNLEDRLHYVQDLIKDKIKFKLDMIVKPQTKKVDKDTITIYTIEIKPTPELEEFASFFHSIGAKKINNKWVIEID